MREHHYRSRDYVAATAQAADGARDGRVHIVSLIVHVRPQAVDAYTRWVDANPELEIHLCSEEGKLVVVMETPDHHRINTLIESIKDQPGVLNAAMVYHEELALDEADDVLQEPGAARDSAQPVKIVGEG